MGNHKRLGELIEAWANGTKPMKTNFDEFKNQLIAESIDFDPPNNSPMPPISEVRYWMLEEGVLNVIVPTKDMLKAGKADAIGLTNGYPFPGEIELAFGTPPRTNLSDPEKETVFWGRIGEYCSTQCF